MKRFLSVFIAALQLTLLVVSVAAKAEVREILHMQQILPAIDQETLLIFDLDNTVMEPVQTLGTDQWFKYMVQKEIKAGVDEYAATEHAIPNWVSVQRASRMVPVEAATPKIIRFLQEKGVTVMALTARPAELAQTTIAELASIGVDFSLRPIFNRNTRIGNSAKAIYVRGIALIGPLGDKGQALVTFLRQIQKVPRNIVFVDDSARNVASVEKALAHYPYGHTSFRYGFVDRKVRQFNPAIADFEWQHFQQSRSLLNDSQALSLMNR